MYSTCLYCHGDLGRNEAIERFPVGRRLAFDAERGRLWVVCRSCERWNLSPLEERWEAIEEAERQFRGTKLRVATDNIGLAKLADGTELVRIGQAVETELAVWRYGDALGRRRRRALITRSLLIGGGVTILAAPHIGLFAGGGYGMYMLAEWAYNSFQARRSRVRLSLPSGDVVGMRLAHLHEARIVPDNTEQRWALRIGHPWLIDEPPTGYDREMTHTLLREDEAVRAAGRILPALNARGATTEQVREAVRVLADEGGPNGVFVGRVKNRSSGLLNYAGHSMAILPDTVRLALEMAAHEATERRALEGELAVLEAAWREAEQIAKIADDLLVPEAVRAALARGPRE